MNGCSWTYFKYNDIIPGQAHYWMPVKYTIRDINDKYCWEFVEESELSEELLEKFCKFFKIDMLFDTFEIYDGPDCLEI